VQLERGEERVEDAGVIRVLHVLDIELPVVGQGLRETPQDDRHAATENALDAGTDFCAEIILERRHRVRKRAEYQAMQDGNAQFTRTMLLHPERVRHAPFAFDAILEGNTREIAFFVIGPTVVGTSKVMLAIALLIQADQRTAMRT